MKTKFQTRLLACLMAVVVFFNSFAVSASAEVVGTSGKYLADVYIAYGTKKDEAEKWLRDNGWEPFEDLNEGKNSKMKTDAVAVLGIKRTDDPTKAITDLAAMHMSGEYSFDDYEDLVAQKKTTITEFINTFVPALNEYRDNYNGQGSAGGKKRAQIAHDILNKFYDGEPGGKYAVNDTGKPLGDLLLNKTKTEIGDNAYNALSAEQKANTADLQQIILESTGPAIQVVEQTLALATDTAQNSWLDRLSGLSGESLVERIAEFAPEAAGQDLAPSAARSLLAAHFEDYAKILAKDWSGVHEDIIWYEKYCDDNDLWPKEDEVVNEKTNQYFTALSEADADRYTTEFKRFSLVNTYYPILTKINYAGEWGETLYDFLYPEDENADYSKKYDYFAPLAAALSDGQRAALEFLGLTTLLKLGMDSDSTAQAEFPSTDAFFKDKNGTALESISIYSGINRAIFRKGVALTGKALTQKNLGDDPYDHIWDEFGLADIVSYSTLAVSTISLAVGIGMAVKVAQASKAVEKAAASVATWTNEITFQLNKCNGIIADITKLGDVGGLGYKAEVAYQKAMSAAFKSMDAERVLDKAVANSQKVTGRFGAASRWMMGIGGALMLLAAALKGVQLYKYYNRTFSAIPMMIVDKADIVTESFDENGKPVSNINFNQFAYYEVVRCNRQTVGIPKSAQGGVSDYASWGCGDAADMNADVGTEWLAMYVNRSAAKGDPILADSLKLEKGTTTKPAGYTKFLHIFNSKNALKIDDTAFCYRDDKNGMYLYWQDDAKAFAGTVAAASVFTGGHLALAGIGGLALGIVGTTLILGRRKKKAAK